MKLALVHDWLTGMRGGEKCLEVLCQAFPNAELFTLLHVPGRASPAIEQMRDLAVMFRNLLHCLLRLPTEPTSRAVVPRAREDFLGSKFHRDGARWLRTGQDIAGIQRIVA